MTESTHTSPPAAPAPLGQLAPEHQDAVARVEQQIMAYYSQQTSRRQTSHELSPGRYGLLDALLRGLQRVATAPLSLRAAGAAICLLSLFSLSQRPTPHKQPTRQASALGAARPSAPPVRPTRRGQALAGVASHQQPSACFLASVELLSPDPIQRVWYIHNHFARDLRIKCLPRSLTCHTPTPLRIALSQHAQETLHTRCHRGFRVSTRRAEFLVSQTGAAIHVKVARGLLALRAGQHTRFAQAAAPPSRPPSPERAYCGPVAACEQMETTPHERTRPPEITPDPIALSSPGLAHAKATTATPHHNATTAAPLLCESRPLRPRPSDIRIQRQVPPEGKPRNNHVRIFVLTQQG